MLDLGEEALEQARAELRAVQEAAVALALLMGHFAREAERLSALVRSLDTEQP